MNEQIPRLDILIYAHDGRGLGHASRSIGIGMALRRLYPELKILFVSGCKASAELIGQAPLDWLKLPSYETEVVAGKSRGVAGFSGYSDQQLGLLRGAELHHLVTLYRPRIVLSDHTPQGKHRELLSALQAGSGQDTRWVLGVRGVVGGVRQVQSDLARQLFQKHYHALFWYGDSAVLGSEHLQQLEGRFGQVPVECGYVSRLAELERWRSAAPREEPQLAGTIAIPWLGENSLSFLRHLARALAGIPSLHGAWRLFVGPAELPAVQREVTELFAPLDHCRLEPLSGGRYARALLNSRLALIYGGYNSVVDVLYAGIPALVVVRDMQDNEQQIHLEKLQAKLGGQLSVVPETAGDAGQIRAMLLAQLQRGKNHSSPVNLAGGQTAAKALGQLLAPLRHKAE